MDIFEQSPTQRETIFISSHYHIELFVLNMKRGGGGVNEY